MLAGVEKSLVLTLATADMRESNKNGVIFTSVTDMYNIYNLLLFHTWMSQGHCWWQKCLVTTWMPPSSRCGTVLSPPHLRLPHLHNHCHYHSPLPPPLHCQWDCVPCSLDHCPLRRELPQLVHAPSVSW